jgi:diamine N-acetyltransferase
MFGRRLRFPLQLGPRPDPPGILAYGRRTRLRRLEREDIDRWLQWPAHVDPLYSSYDAPAGWDREQADRYYFDLRSDHCLRHYALDTEEERLVGRLSLRHIDWRHGGAVLGVSLNPGRLNSGLGTDGLTAFLSYYFEGLRFRSLFLDVAAHNQRAHHIYEKLGFQPYGRRWGDPQPDHAGIFTQEQFRSIRGHFYADRGKIRPLLYDMVLRRSDWERAQRSYSHSRIECGSMR